jgi:uncharacterized membrane protein
MLHEDQDLKKEFQVERLALFSDAVFAIAITLLVIELKIPGAGEPHTDKHLLEVMGNEFLAKFIGFFVSFAVIALYWVNHHLLFGFLAAYNRKLIWANIHFLFTIVLMPFSSGFYSEYWYSGLLIPIGFYAINISLSGLMILRLWKIVTSPENKLFHSLPPREVIRYYQLRSVAAPGIILLSFIIAFFNPLLSYYIPLATPVALLFIRRYYRKKAPAALQ